MKHRSLPIERFLIRCILLIFLFLYLVNLKAQSIPELIFRNPVVSIGIPGADGTKYRFSNVATDLDAVVEILGRSGSQVVLTNIDSTGIGWDKAFQPILGIAGTVPANQEWWMEFRISFYKSATWDNQRINRFVATGLDIDGDGQSIQEWVEMKKIQDFTISPSCVLTTNLVASIFDLVNFNNNGSDFRLIGPVTNFANIDTSAIAVMATYEYNKKDRIDFKLGGKTGALTSTAGLRLNSIWFKEFDLSASPLPVKLIDFAAQYDRNKVNLNWTTSDETAFSHFVIERSTDGKNFQDLSIVFSAGSNGSHQEYKLSDGDIKNKSGLLYYRLKMVDVDKKASYSAIRIIRLGNGKDILNIAVYPNPVATELRITIPAAWQGKEVRFELINNLGQLVRYQKNTNASQTEVISMSDLGKGIYYLKASTVQEVAKHSIIKN
jgi:hypothetical protein